jgi:hypothetical protein
MTTLQSPNIREAEPNPDVDVSSSPTLRPLSKKIKPMLSNLTIRVQASQDLSIEDWEREYDLPDEEITDPNEEGLRLKMGMFTRQFAEELCQYDKTDRDTIVQYILDNREVTSPLIIGWEITELLYQNEMNRPFLDKSLFTQLSMLLLLPMKIFTYFTILPNINVDMDMHKLPKIRLLFNPLFNSYFLAYVITHGKDIHDLTFLSVFFSNFVLSVVVIYPVLFNDAPPTPVFFKLIFANNLVMSLLCFYMMSDLVVDLFRSLHILFNFRYVFFAITLFSTVVWIPAIMGALQTTLYTRVVPGYNGAIFNTLFVFGVVLLIHQVLRGEVTSHMWPVNSDTGSEVTTLFFLLNSCMLPITYVLIKREGYRYTRRIGIALTSVYFAVNAVVMLIGFIAV